MAINNILSLISKKRWQEEGFIVQDPCGGYWLGQGPFSYSPRPDFQSLYHPDFFMRKKNPWIKADLVQKLNQKQLSSFLLASNHREFFSKIKNPSFIQYQEVFFQVQQAIRKKQFQKVVPVFYESFNLKPDLNLLLSNLFKNTKHFSNGFLYGVWNKNKGVLGFTPEILFSLQKTNFFTMALAGTFFHPGPSLLKNKKELKEHNFVLQGIQDSLKSFVKWKKGNTLEMIFPPLKHLRTDLRGRLNQLVDFEQICQSLHPTPALGGYPKKPAFDWLKNHNLQSDRMFFSAPFGFFHSAREFFCLVALRALEWNHEEGRIYSGAGLIQESVLQKEWEELFLKRQQVKQFFQ